MIQYSQIHKALEKLGYTWTYEKLYFHHFHVFRKSETILSCRGFGKQYCYQKVKNWLELQTQVQADEEEYCFT